MNTTLFNVSCPVIEPSTTAFDFGIFLVALQSGVVESTDFPQKFFYCFWWGLQNLRYAHVRSPLFFFSYQFIFEHLMSVCSINKQFLYYTCVFLGFSFHIHKACEQESSLLKTSEIMVVPYPLLCSSFTLLIYSIYVDAQTCYDVALCIAFYIIICDARGHVILSSLFHL